ncbi:MAG: radical SAM protein [Candidatus Bathyarchaeota archaeon]
MSELSLGFRTMRMILSAGSVKSLMKYCIKKCDKCGKRPIDTYLDELAGMKTKKCTKCKVALFIVRFAAGTTMRSLKKKPGRVHDAVTRTYWRRAIASLVKGLAYFGPNKPFSTGAPLLVVWNFTNRCNLKCRHCYQDAGTSQLTDELTTSEALKVVEDLAESDVCAISFSGGEPLARKDFFEVAGRAHDLGMYVSVATNGTLITKDVAKKLAKVAKYAEISLDGAVAETHDGFRGIPGAWEKTVSGIRNCVNEGIYTAVATTATKENLAEIPRLIDFAEKNGVKYFLCFNFVPTGRGKEIASVDLSPTEREDLLKFMYEKLVYFQHNGGPNIFTTAPQFSRVGLQNAKIVQQKLSGCGGYTVIPATHYGNVPGVTANLADFIGGCGAGRVYCGLSPSGIVTPCVFMPIPLGDLRKDNFTDIWINSKVLNDLRDRKKLKGRCGKCKYKYVCGGCRARPYGYYGDYLLPDPGCIRRLEVPEIENLPQKSSPEIAVTQKASK